MHNNSLKTCKAGFVSVIVFREKILIALHSNFFMGNQFWREEDVGDLEDAWSGRLGCGRMCISRDTDPPDVLTQLRLPSESLSGATGGHFVARIKTGFRPMGQSRLVMIAT